MYERLVIEGNAVYELDEACVKEKGKDDGGKGKHEEESEKSQK